MADGRVIERLVVEIHVDMDTAAQSVSAAGKSIDAETKKIGKSMDQTAKNFEDNSKRIQKSTNQIIDVLRLLTGAAFIKDLNDTIVKFDRTMNAVKVSTGATAEEMEKLRQATKGVSEIFDPQAVAESMRILAESGSKMDELVKLSPEVIKLANATSESMQTAADVLTDTIKASRSQIDEAAKLVDMLTVATNTSNQTLQQVKDGLIQVVGASESVGLTLGETLALLNQLAEIGFKGSEGGFIMRSLIAGIVNPSKEAEEALGGLLDKIRFVEAETGKVTFAPLETVFEELGKKSEDTALFLDLFGQRAGPRLQTLMKVGVEAVRESEKAILAQGMAAKAATNETEGLIGEWNKLGDAWKELKINIADGGGAQALETAVGSLTTAIRILNKVLTEFDFEKFVNPDWATRVSSQGDQVVMSLEGMAEKIAALREPVKAATEEALQGIADAEVPDLPMPKIKPMELRGSVAPDWWKEPVAAVEEGSAQIKAAVEGSYKPSMALIGQTNQVTQAGIDQMVLGIGMALGNFVQMLRDRASEMSSIDFDVRIDRGVVAALRDIVRDIDDLSKLDAVSSLTGVGAVLAETGRGIAVLAAGLERMAGLNDTSALDALQTMIKQLRGFSASQAENLTGLFDIIRQFIDFVMTDIPGDPSVFQSRSESLVALVGAVRQFAAAIGQMLDDIAYAFSLSRASEGTYKQGELAGAPSAIDGDALEAALKGQIDFFASVVEGLNRIADVISKAPNVADWTPMLVNITGALLELKALFQAQADLVVPTAPETEITTALTSLENIVLGLKTLTEKMRDAALDIFPAFSTQAQAALKSIQELFDVIRTVDEALRQDPTSFQNMLGAKGDVFPTDGLIVAAQQIERLAEEIDAEKVAKAIEWLGTFGADVGGLVPVLQTLAKDFGALRRAYFGIVVAVELIDGAMNPIAANAMRVGIFATVSAIEGIVATIATLRGLSDLSGAAEATEERAKNLERIADNMNRMWHAIGNILTGKPGGGSEKEAADAGAGVDKLVASMTGLALADGKGTPKGVATASSDIFGGAMDTMVEKAKAATDGVIGYFQNLYMELVGASIVPDMVEEIVAWFERLETDTIEPVRTVSETIGGAFETAADRTLRALEDLAINGKGSMSDLVDSIIKDLQRLALQQFIVNPVKQVIGNVIGKIGGIIFGGMGGGAGGALGAGTNSSAPFGGFRAAGGPVLKNMPYMVGERGPEMFVPHSSGQIVPNSRMMGGGGAVNVHFNFPAGTDQAMIRRSQGQIAATVSRAVARGQRNL